MLELCASVKFKEPGLYEDCFYLFFVARSTMGTRKDSGTWVPLLSLKLSFIGTIVGSLEMPF